MKKSILLPILLLLGLGLAYGIRPFWWETYSFADDQIDVRLDARYTVAPPEDGTLVIRLTGLGRNSCTWDPVSAKVSGPASDSFVEMDSISTAFTDAEGLAPAPPYRGLGSGVRSFLGGCRRNRAYLLLAAREGFETSWRLPEAGKENFSGMVLHDPKPPPRNVTPVMHETRRISAAFRLLYPSRLPVILRPPLDDDDRLAILETARYWRHTTPDQVTLRAFALERLSEVAESLGCRRLRLGLSELLERLATTPEGVPAIVAEYEAIMELFEDFGGPSVAENVCESDATL